LEGGPYKSKVQERFLAAQADRFAGAKREEKASSCSARNDGAGGCGAKVGSNGNFRVLLAKDHAAQFIAEALGLLWVGGVAETLGKLEKLLLLTLFRLDAMANNLVRRTHNTNMHENCAIL